MDFEACTHVNLAQHGAAVFITVDVLENGCLNLKWCDDLTILCLKVNINMCRLIIVCPEIMMDMTHAPVVKLPVELHKPVFCFENRHCT
jgi:hypothetical protein